MIPDPLAARLAQFESDALLDDPGQLQPRLAALDQIEAYLTLAEAHQNDDPGRALHRRLEALRDKWEGINREVYADIRCEIREGRGRDALLSWIPGWRASLHPPRDDYDSTDEVVAGVLDFAEPGALSVAPIPEMVAYQPTPARHILDLLERTAPSAQDVIMDLGSGLGHVALLTAICTEARGIGVEIEPAYVACARDAASRLKLERASFIEQDARRVNHQAATIFYLYTPFRGAMLRSTMEALRRQAETRPLRVCTFGPCTPLVAGAGWLQTDDDIRVDRICVFNTVPLAGRGRP